jgi:hypothetical protein
MLNDLIGKKVQIQINWFSSSEGELIDVNDTWVKLKTKKTIELIKIENIISILAANC